MCCESRCLTNLTTVLVMLMLAVVLTFLRFGEEPILSISGLRCECSTLMLVILRLSIVVVCIVALILCVPSLMFLVALLWRRPDWNLFVSVRWCTVVIIPWLMMKVWTLVFPVLVTNLRMRKPVQRLWKVLTMSCDVDVPLVSMMLAFRAFLISPTMRGGPLSRPSRLLALLGPLLKIACGTLTFRRVRSRR